MLHSTLHIMWPMHQQSLILLHPTVKEKMHYYIIKLKYIIWPWPSGQGHMKCCPVPSKSCDLCTYKSLKLRRQKKLGGDAFNENWMFDLWPWPFQQQSSKLLRLTVRRRRYIYKKIHYLIFDLDIGSRSHKMLPSTLCIMWPIQLQSLKLLRQRFRRRSIYKKIQYLTFDLGVKFTRNVTQYPLHHVTYLTTMFEVATSTGLGVDTFTRNVTDGRTLGPQTDFDTKLIYPFFF